MRTILFTNSNWSIPLMLKLEQLKWLGGIVITDVDHEASLNVKTFADDKNIPMIQVAKNQLQSKLVDWLDQINPDLAICLTFPFRLPEEVIAIPKKGIVNIHFGDLPSYGGADPLFWILKNQERTAVLTFQKMTDELDSGPEIMREQLTIFPGENYGLLGARLSQMAASSAERLMEKINHLENLPALSGNVILRKRPSMEELTIDWSNQTSEQIEALVNAANPVYGGAITYFRNALIHILEVSPANVANTALLGPGSIVHADQQDGLFILCSDYRYLRLNIIKTPECLITGGKLAALGVKSGEKLGLNTTTSDRPKILV